MTKEMYRAWDNERERMVYQLDGATAWKITSYGVFALDPHLEQDRFILLDNNRFELMQYTGRDDKSRMRIYEGDIIESIDFSPSEVIYDSKNAQFVACDINFQDSSYENNDWLVIGNIYQDKNLLN